MTKGTIITRCVYHRLSRRALVQTRRRERTMPIASLSRARARARTHTHTHPEMARTARSTPSRAP